jgi:hypothetical protein
MPFVIVTVGVGVALASLSLEAGFLGQWCNASDQGSVKRYKCGSFWQVLDCQSEYDAYYDTCLYQNRSCCNPSGKSSEKPYYN